MPDVSRLLDRMEEAGLVERERDTADRRLVTTRLSPRGMSLVEELDGPVGPESPVRLRGPVSDALVAGPVRPKLLEVDPAVV